MDPMPAGEAPGGDRVVAAFDFDGTITRRDTLAPFLRELAGPARLVAAAAADLPRLALVAAGRYDRDEAKARLLSRLFRGRPHDDVLAAGRRFADRVVAAGLRPSMIERLRWHREQGHELVIVSASLDVYLHEVGRALDVATVLCTTLEVAQGRCTGRLVGGNCRGPEKAVRLGAHLAARGGPTLLWAYGNSSGDREMLAMADRPVRVTRAGRLAGADGRERSGGR